MQRFTSAHLILFALLTIGIVFTASSCTEDSPTNNNNDTTQIGDTALGRYLATSVAGCVGCHTPTDSNTHAPIMSKMFAGGELFDFGPVKVYSANITPDSATGIGAWTDDQIIKAIRTGIHTHGSETDTLVVMPYQLYAHMSDADVRAIVAFLRHNVAPVNNEVPERVVQLPSIPYFGKLEGFPASNSTQTERGRYLAIIGACNDCHTPMQPGSFASDMTKLFSGGVQMGPNLQSGNITPDTATGIGGWTNEQIDAALTQGMEPDGGIVCPPMPWQMYQGMVKADRDALIAYLRIIPAISNQTLDSCN